MRFTVLTPTYNRGHLLGALFESLCRQTFHDFEWVIIDDGSADDTKQIVEQFQQKEPFFPIIYYKQENGGKHRAWNKGIELASGELVFGCDSDDYLTDDALEITDRVEKTIPSEEKKRFAGVCGLKGYKTGEEIGESFVHQNMMDMTYLERFKNHVSGDKSEVFYRKVWENYKFHEFDGEKFLTEATAQFRMAEDGLKTRFFNEIIKIAEYLPNGLTSNSRRLFEDNPKGWGLYIYQRIKYGLLRGKGKWDVILHYYNCCRGKLGLAEIANNLHLSSSELIVGIIVDRIKNRLKRIL